MSELRKDILVDDSGSYRVEDGDFVVGESDEQHANMILGMPKGSFRENPTTCINLINYLKKQNTQLLALKREVGIQFSADGYKLNSFGVTNGEFDLEYEKNY